MKPLGEMLLAAGAITEEGLREALALQHRSGARLGEALAQLGLVEETTLARTVAKQLGMPFVDLTRGRIPAAVLERVPADFAREQGLLPVALKDGALVVAVDDHLKRIVADQLQFTLGCEVTCAMATPSALRAALERNLGPADEQRVAHAVGAEGDSAAADAPIVRLVTRLFHDAVAARASDIHVEPSHGVLRVRFRVDGLLREVAEHPAHLAAPLISRLKIMARMDIAEKRKPQDGRIGLVVDGRALDVRASILPTDHGETIVMRLLDRSANLIGLRELGFEEDDYNWFRGLIKRPNGIVLVTGPTGSGKTTSLYAALAGLNKPDVKIVTAEDPVEYHLPGINQVQVQPRIGLTFARVLKAMLRAAPNVILVGEIRDRETAEIAIQASLTGHLVFSTLHTNDAPSALTRLMDLGVKPFLVSAAVQAVIGQRLVRRLCEECAESYEPRTAELRALGLDPRFVAGRRLRRARGCRACESTGYRGRIGLFETLELDEELRELTFRGANLDAFRAAAAATGRFHPLMADGARKVLAGKTTVTEVLRVTRSNDVRANEEEEAVS